MARRLPRLFSVRKPSNGRKEGGERTPLAVAKGPTTARQEAMYAGIAGSGWCAAGVWSEMGGPQGGSPARTIPEDSSPSARPGSPGRTNERARRQMNATGRNGGAILLRRRRTTERWSHSTTRETRGRLEACECSEGQRGHRLVGKGASEVDVGKKELGWEKGGGAFFVTAPTFTPAASLCAPRRPPAGVC